MTTPYVLVLYRTWVRNRWPSGMPYQPDWNAVENAFRAGYLAREESVARPEPKEKTPDGVTVGGVQEVPRG